MANALLSLSLAGLEHLDRIEVIFERKAAALKASAESETAALAKAAEAEANAVTPDLQAAIEKMVSRLGSIRALHDDVAAAGATVASAVASEAPSSGASASKAAGTATPVL